MRTQEKQLDLYTSPVDTTPLAPCFLPDSSGGYFGTGLSSHGSPWCPLVGVWDVTRAPKKTLEVRFQTWKHRFFFESLKGHLNVLILMAKKK